jgi:hypothetical protein
MKVCVERGTKLEIVCTNRKASNGLDNKVCGECGHCLTSPEHSRRPNDLSFDGKLAKMQKYLPSGLTEKTLSQRDRIEGRHAPTIG